jgi:myo-inositol-1-phosphate synthase
MICFVDVDKTGVHGPRGATLDSIGCNPREEIEEAGDLVPDVTEILGRRQTNMLVSYLSVGLQKATEWYAERALKAGYAFFNCIPVFIAPQPQWAIRFERRVLPIIDNAIKSQAGATTIRWMVANLFRERGARVGCTYQLHIGGSTDFLLWSP